MKSSKIEWTHHTWNPWRGCTKVSPGCQNCYAATLSERNPGTLGRWGNSGTRVLGVYSYLRQPYGWDRAAAKVGERHRVFCASLADVFEDWSGPLTNPDGTTPTFQGPGEPPRPMTMQDARELVFSTIAQTPNLDWLLLTKRPENIARLWPASMPPPGAAWPNLWLGTTVEDQERADARVPVLLSVPAVVHFLSVEPLLGPVDLGYRGAGALLVDGGGQRMEPQALAPQQVEWVIVGTESGARARNHADYQHHARRVIEQCRVARVPVHHKQCAVNGRVSHDPAEWPADLRVREYPKVTA